MDKQPDELSDDDHHPLDASWALIIIVVAVLAAIVVARQ